MAKITDVVPRISFCIYYFFYTGERKTKNLLGEREHTFLEALLRYNLGIFDFLDATVHEVFSLNILPSFCFTGPNFSTKITTFIIKKLRCCILIR